MKQELLTAYKQMFLIRTAEKEIAELYLRDKIMSFVHFSVGQEAVPVGVASALRTHDKVLGNHRSHGHYLAKGGNLTAMVGELLGKALGCAKGKGGSMHMIDTSVGFLGSTPILGSVVPLATGVAFAEWYKQTGNVVVAFFGDGAAEEGAVYESLNLAALFKLPILYVIENNLYSVNSKLTDRRSTKHSMKKIVTGFGVTYVQADGNNYIDVAQKAQSLVKKVRIGSPALLECMTYRHMAHSAPLYDDAQGYRGKDTPKERAKKDSLARLRKYLIAHNVNERKLVHIEKNITEEVLASIASACKAPYPPRKELTTDIYA